jgi:hypothetical protein
LYPKQTFSDLKKQYRLVSGFFLVGLLLLVSAFPANSQVPDTSIVVNVVQKHSPRKAVMYSLVCPGLGQIYNKKYWKLPFIYGGGGTFVYYIIFNQLKYQKFKDAIFKGALTQEPAIIDGYPIPYETLPRGRDYYRRYRDLSVFGLGAIYLLSIIDAMVDATFYNYDVSDDLTMRIEPTLIEGPGMTASIGFRINFGF